MAPRLKKSVALKAPVNMSILEIKDYREIYDMRLSVTRFSWCLY